MRSGVGRGGSHVVELSLGVLILLVLGLLVIPAVQKVRSLSHRVECQNRLKLLAQALHLHHDLRGVFPTLGGHRDEGRYLRLVLPGGPADEVRLGLGAPTAPPETQPGSWAYQLLPYLDEDALARVRGRRPDGHGVGLPGLLCPARGRPAVIETPTADPLFPLTFHDSVPPGRMLWGRADYAGNGRLLPRRGEPPVRFSDPRPGLSNAILVGEKWLDPRAYATGGWVLDGPALAGGPTCARTGAAVRRDDSPSPLALDTPAVSGWGSAHPGGAHFLFAGGEVRVLRHGAPEKLLLRLIGPSPAPPGDDAD